MKAKNNGYEVECSVNEFRELIANPLKQKTEAVSKPIQPVVKTNQQKYARNHKVWTSQEILCLKTRLHENRPMSSISAELMRKSKSVYAKAWKLGLVGNRYVAGENHV